MPRSSVRKKIFAGSGESAYESPTPSADVNINRRTSANFIAAMMPGTLRAIRCSDLNE